jgi:hypothetical protein
LGAAGAVYQFRHADLQDRLAERFARDHLRTGVSARPIVVRQGPDVVDLAAHSSSTTAMGGDRSVAGDPL